MFSPALTCVFFCWSNSIARTKCLFLTISLIYFSVYTQKQFHNFSISQVESMKMYFEWMGKRIIHKLFRLGFFAFVFDGFVSIPRQFIQSILINIIDERRSRKSKNRKKNWKEISTWTTLFLLLCFFLVWFFSLCTPLTRLSTIYRSKIFLLIADFPQSFHYSQVHWYRISDCQLPLAKQGEWEKI